ncbi:MAG: LiaF-related protein [Chloroflexota bacterium]|nr:LiaF-related protein [Chloroflexota bacterium]
MKRLILIASAISSIVVILLLLRRNSLLTNAPNLDPDRVNATAILGGITEPNASKTFRGGRLTAFLGGVSVNLRHADIIEKPARIHVSAILGGVEISVPQHWNVKKAVQPIAAGVDDRRTLAQPSDDDDDPPDNSPDLVVTGSVLLGGLLIRD